MPRFRLLIEYAGTRYSGWQIQKNARTVQGEIDRAVGEVTGERAFELYGSGRTDAGVHALGQVAHLDVRTSLAPQTLASRINDLLPADIHVLAATKVLHRFHARHDALSRMYIYQIARRRTAFAKPYVWWVKDDLQVGAMRDAARVFTGRRDFRGFTDDDPEDKSTLVEVAAVELVEDADTVLLLVEGSHFLWKMVRRMTGVLVEVGRGGLEPRDVARLLASPSGLPAQLTAPASGLFLARVVYAGDPPSAVPLPPGPRARA
jgi:tRNA pseudouridine38-40 synthase